MLFFELDRSKSRALSAQLYRQLRAQILSGERRAGEQLPSTRSLSAELHVSRNTVQTAYGQLESEELIVSRTGSGVFVGQLPIPTNQRAPKSAQAQNTSLSPDSIPPACVNFDSGLPAVSLFPRANWNRTVSRAFLEAPNAALGYDDPQGRPELRAAIAAWLERARGMRCDAEQILITSGAKQGLTLIAKCLLNSDSVVWMEDPCNANIRSIVAYHNSHILPVPVDSLGIRTECLPKQKLGTLLFVTPARQFPMGGTLPMRRRAELIDFARASGCWIVEDDYDSEFRYDGAPVRSLYELDDARVIYVGTFSKYLFPSLRLGFLLLPKSLVPSFREWKRLSDHHTNSVFQLALARWMESGALERHLRRMKKTYRLRRAELISLIRERFGDAAEILGDDSGLHLIVSFHNAVFTPELVTTIRERGIYVVPVSKHAVLGGHDRELILGFGALEPEQMRRGLDILAECLSQSIVQTQI